MFCNLAFGERRAFSLGFFPSKLCSFVLARPWCYYTSTRALFCFRLGGRLCVGLGLLLGRPGLDGPSWARSFLFDFFGPPFLRPKWPPGFCPNIQKQMVLEPFMQNGGLAEIVSCEPLCSESSCFLECFCEFWWAPFGTKWALWCEFGSFGRRFPCFARTLFWCRFGLLCELQALFALWRPELVAGP